MASFRSSDSSVVLLAIALLIVAVCGQYSTDYTWSVGTDGDTSICNETFADANVTGIFTYTPGVPQLSGSYQYAKPVQLAATVVDVPNDAVEWTMWMNTNGANYSDDLALGYDMCLFTVQVLTTNTFLRGQSDTGNCAATLDSDCNTALTDMASAFLLGLVQNPTPGPNSNLTAGSQSKVCYEVGNSIADNFPPECQKYINGTVQISGAAVTSNPTRARAGGCTLTNNNTNGSFEHLITISGQASHFNYLVFNYFVSPFILSWFPVANYEATNSISTANSIMACPHVQHVNPGSETVPAAPTPTPVGSGGGLSGGAIAGIVVGVVVGVGLIAGAAFWFWRRSKKSKQAKADHGDSPPAYSADAKEKSTPVVEAPQDGEVAELAPDNQLRPELSGDNAVEPQEKAVNEQHPAELLADVPQSNTGR